MRVRVKVGEGVGEGVRVGERVRVRAGRVKPFLESSRVRVIS